MKKIIGIAGQKNNGKDHISKYLIENLGNWKRVAFADAVKQVLIDSFNVSLDFIEKWKRVDEAPPGLKISIRKALQLIGDGFRQIQSDIWIRKAFENDGNLIIPDCRYFAEAEAIQKEHGVNILLWRPGWENDDEHVSENQLRYLINHCISNKQKDGIIDKRLYPKEFQHYDIFLINDGPSDALYDKIDKIVFPYIEKKLY